jgi:MoaA/NifB/PqqE/SkfB family radical SAM enzyme
MSLDAFRSLGPVFKKGQYIHLQGWGEPFAHPDFFEMLAVAKKNGSSIGTTTNGSLLTSESIERLVREQINIIAFSLAGIDKRNDEIRLGTSLEKVIKSIEEIHRVKAKHHVEYPKIHIAYMLLQSGLRNLRALPSFLSNIGADQVVISSLSLVVRPDLEGESFFSMGDEEYIAARQLLLELRRESSKKGVDMHFHIVSPLFESTNCSENIGRALTIGSDGCVSPCVMVNVPVRGNNYHYRDGKKKQLGRMNYGNIVDDTLADIWHRENYKDFRNSFPSGSINAVCGGCPKLSIDNLSGN